MDPALLREEASRLVSEIAAGDQAKPDSGLFSEAVHSLGPQAATLSVALLLCCSVALQFLLLPLAIIL